MIYKEGRVIELTIYYGVEDDGKIIIDDDAIKEDLEHDLQELNKDPERWLGKDL